MDRAIKFRVWNGERMLYPEYFGTDAYGSQGQITIGWTNQSYIDLGSIRKQPYESWEGCTLLQFTGLYDSEGKEVWEGDVIEYTQHHFNTELIKVKRKVVKWNYDRWNIHETNAGESNIKVLGNIYEHPNLLQ